MLLHVKLLLICVIIKIWKKTKQKNDTVGEKLLLYRFILHWYATLYAYYSRTKNKTKKLHKVLQK